MGTATPLYTCTHIQHTNIHTLNNNQQDHWPTPRELDIELRVELKLGEKKWNQPVLKCSPEPSVQFSSFLRPVGVSIDGLLAQIPSETEQVLGKSQQPHSHLRLILIRAIINISYQHEKLLIWGKPSSLTIPKEHDSLTALCWGKSMIPTFQKQIRRTSYDLTKAGGQLGVIQSGENPPKKPVEGTSFEVTGFGVYTCLKPTPPIALGK